MFSRDEQQRYQRQVRHMQPSGHRPVNTSPENEQVSIAGSIKRAVQVQQVVIDSNDRDLSLFPSPNEFMMKLPETLKNVFAVRLLKTEYYNSSNTTVEMFVGDTQIPITTMAPIGTYLHLNNYRLVWRDASKDSVNIFARLSPGIETFQHSENVFKDPYTYVCNPIEPKFERLDIKIYDTDNTISTFMDHRFIIIIGIYTITN